MKSGDTNWYEVQQVMRAATSDIHLFKVSAIVSTYNSEKFISGCLEDLAAQTLYKTNQLEIVVINSGSEQNEHHIIHDFREKFANVTYIRTDHRESMYKAWNRGIQAAKGEYLTNANTDDRHRQDALEVMARELDEHADIAAVYGDSYLSLEPNQTFDEVKKDRTYRYPEFFAPAALLHFQLGPQPMWRKSTHSRIGYFDESYRAIADFDFNLRLALNFKLKHIRQFLGVYLAHAQAVSFRDNTALVEYSELVSKYRKPETIERLYAMEGVSAQTASGRAEVLNDMGIRALEFYPPWREGHPDRDPTFAMNCFEWAIETEQNFVAAWNNYIVATALMNRTDAAMQLLQEKLGLYDDNYLKHNFVALSNARDNPGEPLILALNFSSLNLPKQRQLALPD